MQVSYNIEGGWENRLGDRLPGNTADNTIWVSRKVRNEKGVHVDLNKNGSQVKSDGNKVEGSLYTPRVLNLTWESDQVTFLAPQRSFQLQNKITSLAVSNGGLGLFSSDDTAFIFDTQDGEIRRKFEEHVGEIYRAKLFPSGIVGLSCGADMQIKIWSATDGKCPVTLVGHTKAVTDTDVIELGRNIVSCSKDGKLKVWKCSEARCIVDIETGENLNSCCVLDIKNDGIVHTNESEALQNKFVVTGSEQGTLFFINLENKEIIYRHKFESAINIVEASTNQTVLIGCEDGSVHEMDAKNAGNILATKHPSNSPVTCFLSLVPGSYLCGRQDGSCTLYSQNQNKQVILSGSDYERISGLSKDDEYVYSSSRDGVVRKYSISNILT